MLNEEIVSLDSQEDKELKKIMEEVEVSPDLPIPPSELDSSEERVEREQGEPEEEVVVEYNHNDYADLVGPMKPSVPAPRPAPLPVPPNKTVPLNTQAGGIKKIPKKPGSLPPFALFSQEMRTKLQQEDPDIGFGDLGRKLGELWHSLRVILEFSSNITFYIFIIICLTLSSVLRRRRRRNIGSGPGR